MIQFFCIHDQIKFLILVVKKCHGETSPNKLNNFECKNFFSCVTQWSSVDCFKALTIIWNLKLAKKETHILHRKCLGSLFHKTHYEIFHKRQLSFLSLFIVLNPGKVFYRVRQVTPGAGRVVWQEPHTLRASVRMPADILDRKPSSLCCLDSWLPGWGTWFRGRQSRVREGIVVVVAVGSSLVPSLVLVIGFQVSCDARREDFWLAEIKIFNDFKRLLRTSFSFFQ